MTLFHPKHKAKLSVTACFRKNMICMQLLVKVKVTPVQALRLYTGRTAHRGGRGIALPFLDHGTRRGWGVSVTPRPLFTPGKDPVPIVQEAGWAPELVWTGVENLVATGIRSPDLSARSQSLYLLHYSPISWCAQCLSAKLIPSPAHNTKELFTYYIFRSIFNNKSWYSQLQQNFINPARMRWDRCLIMCQYL